MCVRGIVVLGAMNRRLTVFRTHYLSVECYWQQPHAPEALPFEFLARDTVAIHTVVSN